MDNQSTGARIRQRRIFLGMSQADLAERVGISQASIKKIEKGGDSKFIYDIAIVLETSIDWIMRGIGKPEANSGYWPFSFAKLSDFERLPANKKTELDIRISEFIVGATREKESPDADIDCKSSTSGFRKSA